MGSECTRLAIQPVLSSSSASRLTMSRRESIARHATSFHSEPLSTRRMFMQSMEIKCEHSLSNLHVRPTQLFKPVSLSGACSWAVRVDMPRRLGIIPKAFSVL